MRKHQLIIHGPPSASLVETLKPRLQPLYVVHTIDAAALQGDPWEEQCAVLLLLSGDPLGLKARKRVEAYLHGAGRVVQLVERAGSVQGFAGEVDVVSVEGTLVFRINDGSAYVPLLNDVNDTRSVQADLGKGKVILTTLSVTELFNANNTILQACNIDLPIAQSTNTTDQPPQRDIWTSVPPELLHPTHPLPQIMLVNPEIQRDALGWEVWTAFCSIEDDGSMTVDDENDSFRVERSRETEQVMRAARAESDAGSVKRIICPPTLDAAGPAMPLFHASRYFEHLTRLGRVNGQRKRGTEDEAWNVGDLVVYGEAVTSTQTMLDKNPKLLRALPTPFLSLATFQLSGRGRGTNQWLSPAGCLQFSLLLTLPRGFPPHKLVFTQYLAALAICDGLDADGRLGVRVKWPNDIYAHAEGVGGAEEGKRGKAKLGGILVNSSFVDGRWRVVVGCGINILNDLPTTSLAQLHDLQARRKGVPGKRPSMEESLASILVSFEGFWNTFLRDQGFDGLLDEYLGRWLHTDQPVTLTTTTPHQQLIIKTITLDHGLLRCVPDRRGESRSMYDAGSEDRSSYVLGRGMQALGLGKTEYVDLQPDGNSFDLMSGLIKRKV